MRTYGSISDLADELSEQMVLDRQAVLDAIRVNRHCYLRYEDITVAQHSALSQAVYWTVTGDPYPWTWQKIDNTHVQLESQREGDGENE